MLEIKVELKALTYCIMKMGEKNIKQEFDEDT